MIAPRLLVAVVVLAAGLAACGEDDGGGAAEPGAAPGAPRVVATTTQAADLVRNVAGDRAEVTQLMSPNADPHGYELRPRDVQAVTDADLIVRSGGDLDEWLADALEASGAEADVVTLIDAVETVTGEHGHEEEPGHGHEEEEADAHAGEEEEADAHPGEEGEEIDPHWWHDPHNAVLAVGVIEQALAAADPAGADAYRERAARYAGDIEALDEAVQACWDRVPARQRRIVTTHDALGYYARRYGLEVVGTVIPSLSTQGQPSAGELSELVETIRHERVKVVFAESSVNGKVEQAIADEAGARVGGALWADTLGPEGSDGATYLDSIASNTRTMIDGVSGGAVACELGA